MSARTSTGVVTVVHGRREHLAAQERTLAAQTRAADVRIVVSLDDPDLPDAHVRLDGGGPLRVAAARNAGAEAALARGAETLVFLDVDCLAAPGLVAGYADAVAERPDVVWCGPVTYLRAADRPYPLEGLGRLDAPHAARPAPDPGERLVEQPAAERWRLFWSLSFALSAAAWRRTGGFDEAYTGYGAEDTDLGQRAARAGLRLGWLGDARAYHQHHPTQDPPVQHLDDILRNGRTFAERWGWWPMAGWLEAFAAHGLARRVAEGWIRA